MNMNLLTGINTPVECLERFPEILFPQDHFPKQKRAQIELRKGICLRHKLRKVKCDNTAFSDFVNDWFHCTAKIHRVLRFTYQFYKLTDPQKYYCRQVLSDYLRLCYFRYMKFQLDIRIPQPDQLISYKNKILLIGSCFTEHMSDRLAQRKFDVCSNPHGILFNPLSVSDSLLRYLTGEHYTGEDLFYLNELWNSWDHHTRFSDIDRQAALFKINSSLEQAQRHLKEADWIIITLGSAFQYYLTETGKPVANNHRAPGQWFEKRLLNIDTIVDSLQERFTLIRNTNPEVKFLLTISPVRHIRDGVIENNRSKARLLEAVHQLCTTKGVYYFPAYELVVDVLRDYRFYDIDMVHPNFAATQYVWEQFAANYFSNETREMMDQIEEIGIARQHRTRFPETEAHKNFLQKYLERSRDLQQRMPMLDFSEELRYFSGNS